MRRQARLVIQLGYYLRAEIEDDTGLDAIVWAKEVRTEEVLGRYGNEVWMRMALKV